MREEFEELEPIGILDDIILFHQKRFAEGCEEIYEMLQEGNECLSIVPASEAKRALGRVLWYFQHVEEYEKCSFIAKVYQEVYKEKITPIIPEDIYNGQS